MTDQLNHDHDPLRSIPTGDLKRPSAEDATHEWMIETNGPRTHFDDIIAGGDDKAIYRFAGELRDDELARLSVLQPGTELHAGSVYVDLSDRSRTPFKALGGEVVDHGMHMIAKRETNYELWNRLVPSDRDVATEPGIDRPIREQHGLANDANLND